MWAHRLSKILIFLTLCLMMLGGIVHGTGSSLACPDWPTCYGSLMPNMVGNVAIEHSHRLFATVIGILTIVLMGLLFKSDQKQIRWLGVAALVLVIFQGVLGGITVLYQLPDLVSTAHLGTSMIFLSTLTIIAWQTSPVGMKFSNPTLVLFPNETMVAKRFVLFTTAVVYFQIVLGAFVRHTGSGIVCTEFPTCMGSLWPRGAEPEVMLHMFHRWVAVIVFLMALNLPFVLRSLAKSDSRLSAFSKLVVVLVLVQGFLGMMSVTTSLSLVWVTAHLLGAALLLISMVSLNILLRK